MGEGGEGEGRDSWALTTQEVLTRIPVEHIALVVIAGLATWALVQAPPNIKSPIFIGVLVVGVVVFWFVVATMIFRLARTRLSQRGADDAILADPSDLPRGPTPREYEGTIRGAVAGYRKEKE